MKEEAPQAWRKIHFVALAAVLVGGMILGSNLFPSIKEVPVVRVVEKRVEVPVDRVVDRIVEKRVEVPVDRIVEKRVEVQSDKALIKYVSDRTTTLNGKPTYVISDDRLKLWAQIKSGMSRQQVIEILGPPDTPPYDNGSWVTFTWGQGYVNFAQISRGGLVTTVKPPEY